MRSKRATNFICKEKKCFFLSSIITLLSSQGARYKTRKRDEKVKYDAESFADAIISKLNETDGSPDALSSVLAKEGETQDYR